MQPVFGWLRRHPVVVDGALLAVLLAGSANEWAISFAVTGLSVALSATVLARRRYPVAAFTVAAAVGALQIASGLHPAGSAAQAGVLQPTGADLVILVLLYTLAAHRPRWISLTGLALCLAGSAVAVVRWAPVHSGHGGTALVIAVLGLGGAALGAWVLGDSMRYRRAYNAALEDRAVRAEAERDAQGQIAAAAERARIARELHDVIAHHVSVMVIQANGASYALDANPDRARKALAAISRTGGQALEEMRRLLGVLRTDCDGQAEMAPQPGIGQLGELVEQARAAGVPVAFTVEGGPAALPPGPALAAYRVVQESLTNVRKHGGPGATAAVTLRFGDGALVIEVADDGRGAASLGTNGPGPAPGHGLTGMRERLELYGGTVRSGPAPGGGYLVTARLPVPAAAVGWNSGQESREPA